MTRDEFLTLLNTVYAQGGAWRGVISVSDKNAVIRTHDGASPFLLRFAPSVAEAKAAPSYWRPRRMLPPGETGKPLAGLRIALDPGHLGGYWAKMEERWFQIGNSTPVTEGDMTLRVAKLIERRLEDLGAEVMLTRSKPGPVTPLRPEHLRKAAADSLQDKGDPATPEAVKTESERLFYRVGEIRRRAKLVNDSFRPDLVVCLHFNAEAWGEPTTPELVTVNHLHFLIAGSLSADELAYEDQRFDMLAKLLSRSFVEESAVTSTVARAMVKQTGLPPYTYRSENARQVGGSPYIWSRNLLANRLFACPVIYVEPYVMNSQIVFARVQAGDYEGRRNFGGVMRKSIYREYADAIVDGLVAYYSNRPL